MLIIRQKLMTHAINKAKKDNKFPHNVEQVLTPKK